MKKRKLHGKWHWRRHRAWSWLLSTTRAQRFWWSLPFVVDGWQFLGRKRKLQYCWGWLWAWRYGQSRWQKQYCGCSDRPTRNKRKGGSGPFRWTLCAECGAKRYYGGYDCPRCNAPHGDLEDCFDGDNKLVKGSNLLNMGPEIYNYGVAMNCGGMPYDWEETWWCPYCKNVHSFTNGNY